MQAMASHASGSRITVLLIVVIYTGHLNKQLPGYNLFTICIKMSNDISSTDVQYI